MGYPPSPTPFARAMLNIKFKIALAASLLFIPLCALRAIEYAYANPEPQKTGWPLTDAEKTFILRPEFDRKPGHEVNKHLPAMWPVTPTAGYRGKAVGDTQWLDIHAKLVADVQANKGAIDILILGDSITEYMGGSAITGLPFIAPWKKHFGHLKTVNAGLAGDKIEGVLWRLEHGLLDGASPKVIVLMIGVNNAPLITACSVPAEAVAQGIKLCVDNLREKCPASQVVVVKVLPAFQPGKSVHEDIKKVNAVLDGLKLDSDPNVHVLDVWNDFMNPDGSLKATAYSDGHLHLNDVGYEIYAAKLKPFVDGISANSK